MLVAGVDSSTQSTKVVLCEADSGAIVATAAAPHPDGTECDPEFWWQALSKAGDGLLSRAAAVGVAAQQHGMVALDESGQVIRPAASTRRPLLRIKTPMMPTHVQLDRHLRKRQPFPQLPDEEPPVLLGDQVRIVHKQH